MSDGIEDPQHDRSRALASGGQEVLNRQGLRAAMWPTCFPKPASLQGGPKAEGGANGGALSAPSHRSLTVAALIAEAGPERFG